MKYNKYFETSLYRECNKSRTEANIEIAEHTIHLATILAFVLGALDCLFVWLVKHNIDGAWQLPLIIIFGAICGGLLARLWVVTIRTIRTAYRNYMYDIELLTQKLDAMQNDEEPEEDYELVGDRDD